MKIQKGKEFVDKLRKLCQTYDVEFDDLIKIVKKLGSSRFSSNLDIDEETGKSFWGDVANLVKRVTKRK